MNKKIVGQELHDNIVLYQVVPSCLNCVNHKNIDLEVDINGKTKVETIKCLKYKTIPPAKVIVFSCGSGWEADILF